MRSIRIIVGIVLGLWLAPASSQATVTWDNLGENLNPASILSVTKRIEVNVEKITVYGVDPGLNVKMTELVTQPGSHVFSPWTNLGCCITGNVSAIAWPNYRDVYGLGTDGTLFHNQSVNNGPFSGWFFLEHPNHLKWCGSPAAITNGVNKVSVFVRACGTNDAWYVSWTGSSWVWRNMNKKVFGDMAAVAINSDALEVWAIDANGGLWNDHYRNGGFTWRFTGRTGVSNPAAAPALQTNPAATAFTMETLTGDFIGTRAPEGGQWFSNSGGTSGGIPRVTWWGNPIGDPIHNPRYFVYQLDAGHRIFRRMYTEGLWSTISFDAWTSGEEFAGHPSVIMGVIPEGSVHVVHVFAVKATGALFHTTENTF